jgi:hypothetical protein
MLDEYGQPTIRLAPAWSGVPVLTVLLDGEYFSLQRRPGVALNGGGACYTVRLKQRPADVAAYVRERISPPDSDWWWMARSGGIEVSVRIGAVPKLQRRGGIEPPVPLRRDLAADGGDDAL